MTGRKGFAVADEGGGPLLPTMAPGTVLELHVAARSRRLRLVRATVSALAEDAGFSGQAVDELVSAVDEAFQNVIRHAYKSESDGRIVLKASFEGDCLVLRVIDFAEPVDPDTIHPRPLGELRPGGLGTRLIHACLDEVDFETPQQGAGNCLRLVKRIT
jgi:sigma-B regulation protein RsbU (phosphoserine phosphatase)